MSTIISRQLLVNIAKRDVGQTEVTPNRAPWIKKFWPATDYGDGHTDRAPYCAAALCYWVQQWMALPAVQADFGKTPTQLEAWRCKSAAAYGWLSWAKKKGLLILSDNPKEVLHTGDIVVYDFSHIGLVTDDYKNRIKTIEANTGPSGERDGDGVWEKDRPREIARCFIRLLP